MDFAPLLSYTEPPAATGGIGESMNATLSLLHIIGSVALLLWAVRMIRTGITRAFGARLRSIVAQGAGNRFRAFLAGLAVTTFLQSSTATALIVSSLASRGVLATLGALAVMLGADLGSTVAAQILSFKPHALSPLLITLGVVLFMSAESGVRRHVGRFCIGLGLLLLALRILLEATAPLRDSPLLASVIQALTGEPLIAVLLAAVITWLAHSSLATVLLVMSLAGHGVIAPEAAFALVLGANLGGGIAPVVITAGSAPAGRRAPVGNLVMRAIGVAIALPTVPLVAPYVAMLEADAARQVVNFHTLFNLALAVVMLPLLGGIARLCTLMLPAPPRETDPGAPRYLDREALDTPPVALAAAAREALRMGDVVQSMLARSLDALHGNDMALINQIKAQDDLLDRLHEAIKLYLTRLSQQELDREESRRYQEIFAFITNMEHIGDIIDLNLMEIAEKKTRERLRFSPPGYEELRRIHGKVMENLQLALGVFMTRDPRLARQLVAQKKIVRDLEIEAYENHLQRLSRRVADSVQTSALHLDVIRDLKRINSHLTAIAYPLLEATGELRETRLIEPRADTPPEPSAEVTEQPNLDAGTQSGQPVGEGKPRSPQSTGR